MTAAGERDAFERLIGGKKIVLCLGGGGVGKTTLSAAIAVAAALRGRRTALLTIDPARRLKDALGMPELGADPVRVPLETVAVPAPGGAVTATMLDAKRTFDELVARFAPSLDAAERILRNRIYRYLSGALAGSQEYMALEKLYEIATLGGYDLLVVDTPPTHHALDFLDAPARVIDLLGSRAFSILQRPSLLLLGAGSRLAQAALEGVLRALERFTGLSVLAEVADLIGGFEGMLDGFRDRAGAVRRLLRDEGTTAVLVTSGEPLAVDETLVFHRELVAAGLEVGGVVVNRTVPPDLLAPLRRRTSAVPRALRAKLRDARRELEALAERDSRMVARMRGATAPGTPVVTVPALDREVASLGSLVAVAGVLAPRAHAAAGKVRALRR